MSQLLFLQSAFFRQRISMHFSSFLIPKFSLSSYRISSLLILPKVCSFQMSSHNSFSLFAEVNWSRKIARNMPKWRLMWNVLASYKCYDICSIVIYDDLISSKNAKPYWIEKCLLVWTLSEASGIRINIWLSGFEKLQISLFSLLGPFLFLGRSISSSRRAGLNEVRPLE